MKRYVKELASDLKKYHKEKCKEYPEILPGGFLDSLRRRVEIPYKNGLITDREAVKEILHIWDKLDDHIWIWYGK